MSDELFRNKYRIPSVRATWHDYNGGMYFITICTKDREHYFGEIVDGEMRLTAVGAYVQQCIGEIPEHNVYAYVPLFVVMPNHVHMVVVIDDNFRKMPNNPTICCIDVPNAPTICRDAPWHVSTTGENQWRKSIDGKNTVMQDIANQQGKLSAMIGGFKQSVTRYAKDNILPFAWQPRFHDHIIRDTDEMNRIAKYIENNVAKWETDKFYNQ